MRHERSRRIPIYAHIRRGELILVLLIVCPALAVTSKIVRQSTSADLLKGKTENVVVGSRGTLQLGRAAEVLTNKFEDVWAVNTIVVAGGTTYLGTSPNGGIYKYSLGTLTKIYPPQAETTSPPASPEAGTSAGTADSNSPQDPNSTQDPNNTQDPNSPKDPNAKTVTAEQYLSNQHVFAMATDTTGRLLAGISGKKCKLCRFSVEGGTTSETIFEPNDANYIFAIVTDQSGNIYLGTGPKGQIYRLNPSGSEPNVLYDSPDKNILCLTVGPDGAIYAGSDSRGLIYKISVDPAPDGDAHTGKASVLYDSDQPEVTALLFSAGADPNSEMLYAAATLANIVQTETKFASQPSAAGRPEPPAEADKGEADTGSGLKLKIANTKKATAEKPPAGQPPVRRGAKPDKASTLLSVTKDGYVTDVFSETAVFFCLAKQQKQLLVGTGNNGQLFTVDPASEQQAMIYEDEQAAQITAIAADGADLYIGTANPAKLIKLSPAFASQGTYTSDLIDAGQPARWGKLQIEGDIPQGCKVSLACRSGNVKDINDPTFSDWTEPANIAGPVDLPCPLGRFCQYKLVLQSADGKTSPLIREIALAGTIPNLAPKVESVDVTAGKSAGPTPGTAKAGVFKITYKTSDDNDDKLIYKIDFRKIGRTNWIELEDETEADDFEWDTKTVEDGRYEVRVTASDERGNSPSTKLTGSRISDPVVVDNTGPVIKKYSIESGVKTVTLKLHIIDELTAIGELNFTVNSNAQWKGAVPDDLVCDTTEEDFTITIDKLEPGEHIVAVRISDDVGNVTYKTFEVDVLGP